MSDDYALRSNSIPVNCFCLKADFAESSGTHNTGMAKIIENLLKDMGILTPPQQTDPRVRTTVDGYPICVFHRETADSELTFVGKYNFNNDKSTEATFGFSEGDESWEFKNNTSDRSLFKSADFTGTDWLNDFEAVIRMMMRLMPNTKPGPESPSTSWLLWNGLCQRLTIRINSKRK